MWGGTDVDFVECLMKGRLEDLSILLTPLACPGVVCTSTT